MSADSNAAKRPGGVTGKGFQPGQSGNPGGQPKGLSEFKQAMRDLSPRAVDLIKAALESGEPEREQWAVDQVLNRAWGKPAQAVTGEGGEGPAVLVVRTGVPRD